MAEELAGNDMGCIALHYLIVVVGIIVEARRIAW